MKADGRVTADISLQALQMLAVDELGLDEVDRKIMSAILEKFNGGPAGLNSIAAATG